MTEWITDPQIPFEYIFDELMLVMCVGHVFAISEGRAHSLIVFKILEHKVSQNSSKKDNVGGGYCLEPMQRIIHIFKEETCE